MDRPLFDRLGCADPGVKLEVPETVVRAAVVENRAFTQFHADVTALCAAVKKERTTSRSQAPTVTVCVGTLPAYTHTVQNCDVPLTAEVAATEPM
jgi:hypothetical protein